MHPVEQLFADIAQVKPYPEGVIEVPERIPGVAFFPGGAGLWGTKPGNPQPPMPVGGIMVLGHDFHSEEAYRKSLKQRTEVPENPTGRQRIPPTWSGLRRLFSEVGVPLEQCFFTNAYMGLRKGKATTGRFPGANDAGFVERCRSFLLRQIELQQPGVILTLGSWVPPFIAALSDELAGWRGVTSLQDVDHSGAVVTGVRFGASAGLPCTVAALTHPSLRGSNVHRRRYAGSEGHRAELRILEDALRGAGFTTRPVPPERGPSVRSAIVDTYARWTALSALRSGAPVKSRADVYPALQSVDFTPLFDLDRGSIDDLEFDRWHEAAVEHLLAGEPVLGVGWAAKILNVYLKTRAYVGAEGRPGLNDAIHPPIDAGLWLGIKRRFPDRGDILVLSHCVTKIKDIDRYPRYRLIIDGCRIVAAELGCSLIEVEQLWAGTELKEVADEG